LTTTLNPRFRTGPWTEDTTPRDAEYVNGLAVTERLLTRDDRDAALVRLENGHIAVLGDSVAQGSPKLMRLWATRRQAMTNDADRAWWTKVRRAVGA
jgi:hypothetical protein